MLWGRGRSGGACWGDQGVWGARMLGGLGRGGACCGDQ